MGKLRIAMVGAGAGRGQSWMSTLKKLSEPSGLYEFVALCEVVPEKARASAERWGVKGYSNLLEMLDDAGPDVVLNGTPPDANPMAVGVAARRGVHVVTEIPIAPTCGMADLLIRTCQEHQVRFEVSEQVWMWAWEQLKRRIIAAGLIGTPQHARLYYTNKADYHGINGARMLLGGRPTRVLGYTQEVTVPAFSHYIDDGRTFERWDHAVIEFDNDVTLLFESPPRGRMARRWDVEGTLGQLFGEALYIGSEDRFKHYPFITENTTVNGESVFDHIRVDTDPPVVFENPHKQLRAADGDEVARMDILLQFHRAVTAGEPVLYGPQNARTDIEILFAMRESHARGNTWVDLPLTEPTAAERRIEAMYHERFGDPAEPEKLVNAPFRQGGTRYWVTNWE